MAALSGGVVIPEAGVRSGSLTTVFSAHGLGRGIGAVPGSVTSAVSNGPNELIKQGVASVITQTSDVIALLDADEAPERAGNSVRGDRVFGYRRPTSGTTGPSI